MARRFLTQIEPGQAVKVRLRTEQSQRTFVTYVRRVTPEYLEIAVPLDEPGLVARPPREPLEISFLKQGLYLQFEVPVKSEVEGERPSWLVPYPGGDSVKIVNRRRQSRCPMKVAVLCHQVVPESAREQRCLKGYLMDLSPGGARLVCNQPLTSDSLLSLEFYLDQIQEPVLIQGKVVRQIPHHQKDFGYGVRFQSVPEQFQKSLAEFLY